MCSRGTCHLARRILAARCESPARAASRVALLSVASLVTIGGVWTDDAAATSLRVTPGSTLTQIASTYGTSVAALVDVQRHR